MDHVKAWVADLNTTNFRIVVSVSLAIAYVIVVLGAMVLDKHIELGTIATVGGFLLTMMGLDVAQFASKRFSDAGYATAKNAASPVTVEAPSTVTVTPAKDPE